MELLKKVSPIKVTPGKKWTSDDKQGAKGGAKPGAGPDQVKAKPHEGSVLTRWAGINHQAACR